MSVLRIFALVFYFVFFDTHEVFMGIKTKKRWTKIDINFQWSVGLQILTQDATSHALPMGRHLGSMIWNLHRNRNRGFHHEDLIEKRKCVRVNATGFSNTISRSLYNVKAPRFDLIHFSKTRLILSERFNTNCSRSLQLLVKVNIFSGLPLKYATSYDIKILCFGPYW